MIIYLSDYYPGAPDLHRGGQAILSLFCLAPHGVFRAPTITRRAVGSYPAFSPFPRDWVLMARFGLVGALKTQSLGGLFSVTLSVIADFHRRFPRVLHGMLPCGVRTFLHLV